ncbi:hypothetical protein MLD38_010394 [Melastoma candidum]|uniref:Uncharacterized protein n=1 Tax=Melastoma candidum TaxID=119954 RepID=A0ACB9QZN7_9MYRT|nr:hypothetical protein MLD38_010394 [Melastoma candidum]
MYGEGGSAGQGPRPTPLRPPGSPSPPPPLPPPAPTLPSPPLLKKPPSLSPSSAGRSKFSPRKPPPESPSAAAAAVAVSEDPSLDNPDLGPFLLKLARDAIAASSSVEGPAKALEYALRASRSFERALAANPGEEARLNHAMSLHVVAAVYCSLGRYEEGCRWSRGPWRPSRRTG